MHYFLEVVVTNFFYKCFFTNKNMTYKFLNIPDYYSIIIKTVIRYSLIADILYFVISKYTVITLNLNRH